MPKLCYSYVRFSSPQQSKGDSLRRQTAKATAWADRNGYVLDTSLSLADLGVSAYRGLNAAEGALGAFLKAVETKQVPAGSALVIESLDRISREEIGEALNLFLSILRKDIEIVTLEPEHSFTRNSINDIPNILTAIIYMARANEESKTKSERIKAVFNKQLADKSPLRVTHTPYWLRLVDGRFEVIPEHVKSIKQIYEWRLEGLGYAKILDKIREKGIKPFNRTKKWTISYISQLFRAKSLTGEYHPGEMLNGKWIKLDPKFIISNFFPEVIDRKTFDSLQSERPDKGRIGENVTNLFTKLVIDPTDGSNYLIHKSNSGKTTRCLISASVLERKKKAFSFPYKTFEEGILMCLREFDIRRLVGPDDQKELHASIASLDKRIEVLKRKMGTDEDYEAIIETVKSLQKQKKDLQAKIKQEFAIDSIETLGELIEVAEGKELRAIRLKARAMMPSLIEKIEMRTYAFKRLQVACCRIIFRTGKWRYIEIVKKPAQNLFALGVTPEESYVAMMSDDNRVFDIDLSKDWKPIIFNGTHWAFPLPEGQNWGLVGLTMYSLQKVVDEMRQTVLKHKKLPRLVLPTEESGPARLKKNAVARPHKSRGTT